jgi:hypothetical protein
MPTLSAPATNVFYNAEVSARRYPDKPYLIFYDTPVTFAAFFDEAQRVAGFLEHHCGVRKGDRVLLYLQNSPQFAIGYYGILRATWDRRTDSLALSSGLAVTFRGHFGGRTNADTYRSVSRVHFGNVGQGDRPGPRCGRLRWRGADG